MERAELLSKITPFPILAKGLAADLVSGNYRSIFKGQGIEFDEVRRYEVEDDASSIDWNVSARFGVPYIKMYREEREMTVCVVLDTSASMHTTGSEGKSRNKKNRAAGSVYTLYDQGLLAAALIAFSVEKQGQRFSALFFDRHIRRIFPPRKGRMHTMSFISAALENRPMDKGTGLGIALTGARRLLKRRSLVVVISDFLSLNWEHEMGEVSRRHDVIAIRITSPLDNEIFSRGLFTLEDPETGIVIRSPQSAGFRSAWKTWHDERSRLWEAIINRCGAAGLNLSTEDDAASVLAGFFKKARGGRSL